jgi:phage FluMu protein Com
VNQAAVRYALHTAKEGEGFVIKFRCDKCGQKFTVPEVQAGKRGRCPKCKAIVTIPKQQSPGAVIKPNDSAYDLTLLDVPETGKVQKKPVSQYAVSDTGPEQAEESQHKPAMRDVELTGERKLPWLLDIFLYPTSKPGLTGLGIIVGVPLLIDIVMQAFGPFALTLALPRFIFNILIGLYVCWYFAECVRDSAAGGTRAPEVFATADVSTMFEQSLYLAACYIIFAGPAGFYSVFTHKTDAVFWFLAAYGVFFFPIGLLAAVMFNSGAAFNPILWVGSIFSVFFQYCGLVLLLCGVVLPIAAIMNIQPEDIPLPKVLTLILQAGFTATLLYIVFVIAHLLGRFYWRYRERLNWEV